MLIWLHPTRNVLGARAPSDKMRALRQPPASKVRQGEVRADHQQLDEFAMLQPVQSYSEASKTSRILNYSSEGV